MHKGPFLFARDSSDDINMGKGSILGWVGKRGKDPGVALSKSTTLVWESDSVLSKEES